MTDHEKLDEAVMRALRFSGLSDDQLQEIVGIITDIQDAGARPVRVFPKGVTKVDGASVEVEFPAEVAASLLDKVAVEERIEEIRVWGVGVAEFERFGAQIGVH